MDGLVFNIQRYCLQDGPGIRTTVFFKGCPLSCAWCQNPESRSSEPEIVVVQGRCADCGECRAVCRGVPAEGDGDTRVCIRCGACVAACPTGARWMLGRRMSVDQVLTEILKDRLFYEDSGGGVTFSGGEPLLQAGFLNALLDACRADGIHTAVDTCGYASRQEILATAARADLFLYDLKLMDENEHRMHTGVSNQLILENLAVLARVHDAIWIRVPIIPGVNDGAAHLDRLAGFVATLPGIRQVNLIPYHETGTYKFARAGESYPLGRIEPPLPGQLEEIAGRFRALGLSTVMGG